MIIPAVYTFMGTEGMSAGPGLMFVSLPKVFKAMGAAGVLVGIVFFLMVSFAAVTSSTNQEAEGLVAALMEYGVPFTMKEKLPNLFRHWICKNMIAYLKMAQGDRSRSTFLEIMNRPNRYIAREALAEKNIDFLFAVYRRAGTGAHHSPG